MAAKIQQILLITTPRDFKSYNTLLGDGSEFGVKLEYAIQESPRGLADAFIIGADFVGDDRVALVLGDNLFHGQGLGGQLANLTTADGATIFAYRVADPSQYGVVEFGADGRAISLVEKPTTTVSNFAVPGLYFYDNQVVEIAREVVPSARGEIEITSVNLEYLRRQQLNVVKLERGTAWLDTGTPTGLSDAALYVRSVQERQGLLIGSIHEIAWRNAWISDGDLRSLVSSSPSSVYSGYLEEIVNLAVDRNLYDRE